MRQPPPSIAHVLDRALAEGPGRDALVTRSRRLTYAALDAEANRAAHALRALGVRPGDRVAASLPNDAAVVVAFHGAMRLGAVWLGINRALAPPEKRFQLDDTEASILLCDDELPDLGTRVVGAGEWQDAMSAAGDDPLPRDVDPDAPAGIAYTSGTTGRPKGALHSQRGLLAPGAVLVESRGYDSTLRKGDCFPFTILNMAVLTTLLVSQAGGTSIVMDRIDAEGVAEWIRDERVTTWNGPPALLYSLASMDAVAPGDLASLREVWTGGADCPEAIRSAFEAKFGLPVLATYGLTEAPTVVAIDPVGGPHVAGASGRPLPHLSVRAVDDDGQPLPPGESGEVCVAPAPGDDRYRLMLGYWRRPDDTAKVLAGDALHTGDIGFVDDGGVRAPPRPQEPGDHPRRRQRLPGRGGAGAPGVRRHRRLGGDRRGRRAARRAGRRAGRGLRRGPALDVDAVREHCARQLARYKVPERFVVVDALPRNAMGKVARTELPALL